MIRRKYTIEASIMTLAKFTREASAFRTDVFIERVTPDKNEEYYYVVVLGIDGAHQHLKRMGFNNSHALAGKAMGDGNGR